MKNNSPKILVIGLDGATWDLIMPLVKENKLRTFKSLIDNGTCANLESTMPPISIRAWPSMFTGKKQEKFGVYDFKILEFNSENNKIETKLALSDKWKGNFIWDIISKENYKSFIINIPGTYTHYPINGHLIGLDFAPLNMEKSTKEVYKELEKILETVSNFHEKYCHDAYFIRFGIPDNISHLTLDDGEMEKCQILMDKTIKLLIDKINPTNLFIVSDHGIKKESEVFYINIFLKDNGFLKILLKSKFKLIISNFIIKLINKDRLVKYYNFFSSASRQKSKRNNGTQFNLDLMDINNTKAFSYSFFETNYAPIYIIDKKYKKDIINKLKNSNNIKNIYTITPNKKAFGLKPDIIIESNKLISTSLFKKNEREKFISYTHDVKGIFLSSGPEIKNNQMIEDVKIYDITPTILHILDIPIPSDMDGRVLTEIFEEDSELAQKKPKYVEPYYYESKYNKFKKSNM
ncbi:MAG: hypothetical protein HPY60_07695 [Candidatus Methanofastidiosum sp.]|nr:hypothetical protein [Methanofastidiosum sp.]